VAYLLVADHAYLEVVDYRVAVVAGVAAAGAAVVAVVAA